jgi:hypothetical protein
MRHYRALFDELVEPAADQPTTREHFNTEQGTDVDLHSNQERTVR